MRRGDWIEQASKMRRVKVVDLVHVEFRAKGSLAFPGRHGWKKLYSLALRDVSIARITKCSILRS